MIKYLHRNYLRTHPFNPNQPETRFLRLPHQFIFTLVLAGNFLAAVSLHTQALFSLAEHSNTLIALHPPSLPWPRSGSNIPWGTLTQEIQSERRPFCTTWEDGQINGKSQEIPTCFSRTSIMLLFTCHPSLYWDMRNSTGKATHISSMTTQTLEWQIFYFLCSTQRANVMFRAETLLIGVVWLLVFFWS